MTLVLVLKELSCSGNAGGGNDGSGDNDASDGIIGVGGNVGNAVGRGGGYGGCFADGYDKKV